MTSISPRRARSDAPPPLVVAISVTALQGLFFLGYAILEIARTDQDRMLMGTTTSLFFGLYGAGLILCCWRLIRLDSWARSPVVLAQLIHLGLAWSFWGPETWGISVTLVIAAVVVLAGLFHPASVDALADPGA